MKIFKDRDGNIPHKKLLAIPFGVGGFILLFGGGITSMFRVIPSPDVLLYSGLILLAVCAILAGLTTLENVVKIIKIVKGRNDN